jgi:hypothetical protein
MTFEEMLEQVTDENLRKQMKEEFTKVKVEAGERGRKLIEKDGELNTLKKGKSEWESTFNLFKAEGMDVKDIPSLLEKMKIQKTTEDEVKVLTVLYKQEQEKSKGYEKKAKDYETRTAVDTVFNEVRKNFKTEKGEPILVVDDFIDQGKLYADVSDPSNKVLLEERAKEVLTGALQKQEAIKTKMGFQGAPTFKVPEGSPNPGGPNNIAAQLQKVAKENGAGAALSEYYKLAQVNT